VGNNYNCLTFEESSKVFHYRSFICGIKGVGSLIEENKIRILVNSPCNKKPLFLARTKTLTVITYPCIVSQWQALYVISDVGCLDCPVYLFPVGYLIYKPYIACYGI